VAAALTLYGGIAVVVWTWVRARWRWLVLAAASLAVGSVAAGRLYYGVHYPTDVAGSLLLAGCWLLATGYILRPATTTCPRRVA
jgi:undecaprenyl-diphosphatase